VTKVYKKMFLLEKGKFMPPKLTSCFTDLIDTLHINVNYDTLSECSSVMSQTFSLRKEDTDDRLRSNQLLASKKNLLELRATKIFNSSSFSLSKHPPPLPESHEEEIRQQPPRTISLDPDDQQLLRKERSKGKFTDLKNLRELRGTLNMPRVENFLPRKEQLEPVTLQPKKNSYFTPKGNDSPPQNKVAFRRNKYSRADIKMEDV
jgi:hypothetical protein